MMQRDIDPDDLLGKAYDERVARRLLDFIRPYKSRAALAIAFMFVAAGADLLLPKLFSLGIDEVAGPRRLNHLNLLGGVFVLALVVRFGATWGETYLTAWLGNRVVLDLRNRMFRHVQSLSMDFIDRRGVGAVMTRIQNDVTVINDLFTDGIFNIFSNAIVLAGIVILMLVTNWRLALLAFVVLPIMAALMSAWRRRAVETYRATRRTIGIVNADLAESISGVRVSQSFRRERHNNERFDRLNRANFVTNRNAARLTSLLFPVVNLLGAMASAVVLYVGGRFVFRASLSIGDLVLFIALIDRFFDPIRDLSQQYNTMQAAMAAGERIFELLDTEPSVQDRPGARELARVTGAVDYDNVTFGYGATEVLHGIDLHVSPGQTIALVGETGAGKSSIVNLLMRFYEVRGGAVRIDGIDVREVTQRSLRSQLGIVPQDTFLFGGTVSANIRYGRPDATDTEVEAAARGVGAHDFIVDLPHGYDTPVHERGISLSVGQRQLLSFARALLADPRILILDEATSSIDTHTELLIQEGLRRLLEARTSFVIAHRLSTIREADVVVVLHDGRIVEQGTHDELLARRGYYFNLYSMRWRGEAAAD